MKNAAARVGPSILLIGLVMAAPGCSSQEVPHGIKGTDTEITESAFVDGVKAAPANKRWEYVRQHMEVFEMLKNDPDKSKLQTLQSLLPPKGG
jgi:hypothetical protein